MNIFQSKFRFSATEHPYYSKTVKLAIYKGWSKGLHNSIFRENFTTVKTSFVKKYFANSGTFFFQNLKLSNGMVSKQKMNKEGFFKLASVRSVKTACVCIVFFFHYFKYYDQNVFSRISVSYIIV